MDGASPVLETGGIRPGEEEEEKSEEVGGCSLPATWVISAVVTCGDVLLA